MERITLCCAHTDFSVGVPVCLDSAQILYSVFASSGVQQYAGELVNANECMEYDASPHNFNTTACKCAYVDIKILTGYSYKIVCTEPM